MAADQDAIEEGGYVAAEMARARRRRRLGFARGLLAHRSFAVGLALSSLIALLAIFADLIAPYDPNKNDYRNLLAPPSAAHWFGTDGFGRDILSRVIHGTRVSLRIGIS